MMGMQPSTEPWQDAVRRATEATAADRPGGMDETCWDDVAMRNIVAMVLYALHLRDGLPAEEIRWQRVLWHLYDNQRARDLITTVLPGAGHDPRTAPPGDPVAECWRWLTRTCDPAAPVKSAYTAHLATGPNAKLKVPDTPEYRWGGLSRGIANALPDPAMVRNSSGVSRASLSQRSSGLPGNRMLRPASPGVSDSADKRYSFETIWGLAA